MDLRPVSVSVLPVLLLPVRMDLQPVSVSMLPDLRKVSGLELQMVSDSDPVCQMDPDLQKAPQMGPDSPLLEEDS